MEQWNYKSPKTFHPVSNVPFPLFDCSPALLFSLAVASGWRVHQQAKKHAKTRQNQPKRGTPKWRAKKRGAPNVANVAKCRTFWGCDKCDIRDIPDPDPKNTTATRGRGHGFPTHLIVGRTRPGGAAVFQRSNWASKAMAEGLKSIFRTNAAASAAPCSRSIRLSSHSTDSGP